MPTELPPKNVGDHTSTRGISGLAPRVVRGRAHSKGGAVEGVYLVKKNELSCNQLMRKARTGTPPDLSDSTARRPPRFFIFFVCFFYVERECASITVPWLELELQRGESEKGSEVVRRLLILQQEVEDNRSAGRGNIVVFHIPTGSKGRQQACGASL